MCHRFDEWCHRCEAKTGRLSFIKPCGSEGSGQIVDARHDMNHSNAGIPGICNSTRRIDFRCIQPAHSCNPLPREYPLPPESCYTLDEVLSTVSFRAEMPFRPSTLRGWSEADDKQLISWCKEVKENCEKEVSPDYPMRIKNSSCTRYPD